ncbi:BREX system P-loop protein BrxC [Oceanobacter sp. 5_MG-2023]|uniref:BREX system P-loop protein BrxC n=1 Tax=Oceanobacter sp. 5_MG-2023 TaxID=3062645 RepID=UPI0026E46E77|nr:BREX system P-loop protein BrxC [Oceanobacter sp. 5_MG-2023]MDO6683749.1 BREX system P-loop protein BrxC [Oceanobacter sp. 5_MG-2023]
MTAIKDIFYKNIERSINGVVKADQKDDSTVYIELDEYVVTKELDQHFRAFFEVFSTSLDDKSLEDKIGVWISGFFGSGKSHFLKILSYLLANVESTSPSGDKKHAVDFFDETKIQDAMIRADIQKAARNSSDVILFNIDSKSGTRDDSNPILDVFLRVFNEFQGFSSDHPHIAHLERYLENRNILAPFTEKFAELSGSTWKAERDAYHFFQDDIQSALAAALNISEDDAEKWFEDSEDNFDVNAERFCEWVKEYLDKHPDPNRRILFLVDEIGQFIGKNTDRMLKLQTLAENLGTICKGRAWIVVTAQADMDATLGELSSSESDTFSKIAARFSTRLSLSGANVDEVIEQRLLRKTPVANIELKAIYTKDGDILKNQIIFDKTGPTLRSFENESDFVQCYPYPPYQFRLLQSVFTEIRKVGATGAALSNASRSMLDSFQVAALQLKDAQVGALVPMHYFYRSVESFLEPAVKQAIDNAATSSLFTEFDISLLKTLFMIRYVDLVKGTVDNLITLSLNTIDEDKVILRKNVEESLQLLEKQCLITLNGNEYLFLTNEERDITRKIRATDISTSEETKALTDLIYKELLNDKNKFRYLINKQDYSIGRFLDGHSLDGRYEADLKVEVLSPLDPDYNMYSEAACINRSTEGMGSVIIKLPDDRAFFTEVGTWLRTNKFIRLNNDSSQQDISRILADRGRENQERRTRLRINVESLMLSAEVYCLGQHLSVSKSSIATRFDEGCLYLLENTFTKLAYLKVLQSDPLRELSAVLTADDIAQLGLSLDGAEGNPQAVTEMQQYIHLKASGNDRILVSDIVDRFSKRPFGWADNEILLILARLAVANQLTFQLNGGTLANKDAFEPLSNSRKRRELAIIKKRQTDENVLKQARNLTKDLFSSMGPAGEKELFAFYNQHINQWLSNLTSYKSKTDLGGFPGSKIIGQSINMLQRLLSHDDSFDFFKHIVSNKNDYLDLEEDYSDVHEFFSNQLTIWQQLKTALTGFESNKQILEKDQKAAAALQALKHIKDSDAPYNMLNKVAGLIDTVKQVNDAKVEEKREHALERLDHKILMLQQEITKSGIENSELSNRLLRPLQQVKENLTVQASIPQILMLQTHTADEHLDDSLKLLASEVLKEQDRRAAAEQKIKQQAADSGRQGSVNAQTIVETAKGHPAAALKPDAEPAQKPLMKPKTVAEVSVSKVYDSVLTEAYIETPEQAEQFLNELRQQLNVAIQNGSRVRIK